MAQPSLSMPDEMESDIDDRRHSTTYRSTYIREAIAIRFLIEDSTDYELDDILAEARTEYLDNYENTPTE